MNFLKRGEITLAYQDHGQGDAVALLLHGWGCDHTFLQPQADHLRSLGLRVISLDLRGHGESSASESDYTMALFADDAAYLCSELNLKVAIVVGHSMGGVVGLELAAHRGFASSLVLIDSVVLPDQSLLESLRPLRQAIRQSNYKDAFRAAFGPLMLPGDSEAIREKIQLYTPRASQHVLASALDAHFDQETIASAAANCRVPVAYIGAANALANLDAFRGLTPQLQTAQTLCSGHFSTLQVPGQINQMLSDFLSQLKVAKTPELAAAE